MTGAVIDVGGEKTDLRGFPIQSGATRTVVTLNISADTEPDIVGSATEIPAPNSSFDGGILTEVLEHLPDPELAISELSRVLKPRGILLCSMPFAYKVHGDPEDYSRWTESKLRQVAEKFGFEVVLFDWTGTGFASVIDALVGTLQKNAKPKRPSTLVTLILQSLTPLFFRIDKALLLKAKKSNETPLFASGWTAVLRKKN